MWTPADKGSAAGRRDAMGLSRPYAAVSLDYALTKASEVCHASQDGRAVIYCSTAPGVADFTTGEAYLVFRADDATRFHLNEEQGWREVYTVSAAR